MRGEPVERWIGRQGAEVDVLFSNLRAHGTVRHFSTVARGEFGTVEDVEIVAGSAVGNGATCHGLAIRSEGWRGGREKLGGRELPRTVEQFTELVGRVPMKNLVRETTDLIERLCIQAALELTRENQALRGGNAGTEPTSVLCETAPIWPGRGRPGRRRGAKLDVARTT